MDEQEQAVTTETGTTDDIAKEAEPTGRLRGRRGEWVIPVRADHIADAMQKDSSHCMTAEGIKEAIPNAKFVSVDLQSIRWTDPDKGLRYIFLTPRICQAGILAFDQGEPVEPFVLRMRPAQVIKSGMKNRYQRPDAKQLSELGLAPLDASNLHLEDMAGHTLSIPAEMPAPTANLHLEPVSNLHLEPAPLPDDPTPNLHLAEGEQAPPSNTSLPEQAPTRKRRDRRSLARRTGTVVSGGGVVPTIIGGQPPGLSVLARREFGLRALRR